MHVPPRVFPAVLATALIGQALLHGWFIREHSATFDDPAYPGG